LILGRISKEEKKIFPVKISAIPGTIGKKNNFQ